MKIDFSMLDRAFEIFSKSVYSTVHSLTKVLFSFVLQFKLNLANRSILNIWIFLSIQVSLPMGGNRNYY